MQKQSKLKRNQKIFAIIKAINEINEDLNEIMNQYRNLVEPFYNSLIEKAL